jgi:hypothetical protein
MSMEALSFEETNAQCQEIVWDKGLFFFVFLGYGTLVSVVCHVVFYSTEKFFNLATGIILFIFLLLGVSSAKVLKLPS